jgi:hypothetical protein
LAGASPELEYELELELEYELEPEFESSGAILDVRLRAGHPCRFRGR